MSAIRCSENLEELLATRSEENFNFL